MTLTIESFLPHQTGGSKFPNTVLIKLPNKLSIRGLLSSDISVGFQNKFGPLVPDISGLADIASIMNSRSMPAWIGASAQAWKGTDPIKVGITFYLINYAPGLNYASSLESLAEMCTMSKSDTEVAGSTAWTVKVHGGYQPHLLSTNSDYFDAGVDIIKDKVAQNSFLGSVGSNILNSPNGPNGTIELSIGNTITLKHLLLFRLNITPSLIEVPDKKPLYYKVDADFQTFRAALSTDVSGMFA